MVEDEIKLVPIPDEKLKHYLKTSKSLVCCDCGVQEVEWYPYAYDPEENDVWFVGNVLIVENCVLVKNNMSYNDFTLEQLNFIRTHWDYSELCKAIKEKNGSN